MSEFLDLTNILLRIRELQEHTGLKSSEFCLECGIPSSSYSQLINGRTKLNIDIINKIISRWGEEYSPHWLLFGDSQGLEQSNSSSTHSQPITAVSELVEEVIRLREIIKSTAKPKEIDQITIYYTDKSFAIFKLSND